MALKDIEGTLVDPAFQGLPAEEKIKVLNQKDPDFLGLPEPEKRSVIERLPKELTSLPGQPPGALLTGRLQARGVSNPFFRLSPEEQQQQLLLEEFALQNPKTAATADIGRFALETGGGLIGALPGAPAGPLGAVATGGLGFAGGKQLADILDQLLATPRGTALSQRTATEGATEFGTDVALGTALEGLIRGGGPALRKTIEGIANVPGRFLRTGASPEAMAIADQLAARGVEVTPGMATQAPLMKGAESVLESFPFSGTRLTKEFEAIESQFAQAQEGALTSLGPKQGDVQFGEKLKGMLQKGNELSQEGVRAAYEAPEAIIGDTVEYEATEASKAALELLKKERVLPSALREQVGLLRELAAIQSFNWPSLVRIRARVNDLIDGARLGGRLEEANVLENLNAGIRKDLRGFAEKYGADDAINAADEAFVARQEIFSNPRMSKLLQADPEAFKRLVAKGESASLISNLRNVVGEQGFAPVKRTFAEKIFSSSAPMEEFGDDTLNAVFSPSELSDLKSFVKQAEFLSLRKPSQNIEISRGVTKRLIGLSPYGVALVASPLAGAGTAIATTIPPAIVAKLWLSPTGRKYLLDGVKIPAGSPAANRIANTLRAIVAGGSAIDSVMQEPTFEQQIQEAAQVPPP